MGGFSGSGGPPEETTQTTRVDIPDFIRDDLEKILNQASANYDRQQRYIAQRPLFEPEERLARNYLLQRALPGLDNLISGVGSNFDALTDPFGQPGALESPIDIAGGALAPFNFRLPPRDRSASRGGERGGRRGRR